MIIALFQAFMSSSVFNGVGGRKLYDLEELNKIKIPWKKKQLYEKYMEYNQGIVKDYHGFAFFCATDQFLTIAIGQILQLPEINTVYYRESQSQMYSPSAFFFSKWLVSTLVYMMQPLVFATIAFPFVEFADQSHDNYRQFLGILALQATTSSSFGFFFSTLVQDDTTALICHNLCSFVLYFCSPAFSIISQRKNILIKMLEPMSPFTYTCELLLRRLLDGSRDKDRVLDFYGYTKGEI